MGKNKALSINIILFSISSFGTKFFSFFLVPFYTNYLSTSEYGTIDLIINTASLLLPIFTLTVYDGVMRFTLSDKKNSEYLLIGIKISSIGSALLALLLIVISILFSDSINKAYLFWIWCVFACNALYSLTTNYLRAIDLVSVMVQGSLINSILLLCFNIFFIAVLHIGVTGYFISTVMGLIISCIYMVLKYKFIKRFDRFKLKISNTAKKELLMYSIPLIFTAIAWWINSSLDRYFVTWLCGIEANGIYSVAYKIPNLLIAFQTIFTQAWSISAVKEFDSDDTDGFMGHTYEIFNVLMLLACMGLILINIPLSRILYAKDFFEAWQYVPFLLCSTLFGAMAGYYGGIFAAVKDSKICAISTMVSAIINATLNFVLIPLWKIQGAAVATLIAYMASWVIRAFAAKKYVKLKMNSKRLFFTFILLQLQLLCAISDKKFYLIQMGLITLVIVLYRELIVSEICSIVAVFKKKFNNNGR